MTAPHIRDRDDEELRLNCLEKALQDGLDGDVLIRAKRYYAFVTNEQPEPEGADAT